MSKQLRVLFIAGADADTAKLVQELERSGYVLTSVRVDTATALAAVLERHGWDLILSGWVMNRFSATAALGVVKEKKLDIPFLVVSEKLEEGLAVAAMKAGAHDFLLKGNLSRLVPAVERELRDAAERNNRRRMQTAIRHGKMEWEAAFDAVSDLIILTDLGGRIIRCNKRVIAYFNCDYGDVLGREVTELFYGEQPDNPCSFQLSPECTDVAAEEDIRFPMIAGWFSVSSYPMQFAGNPYGRVHIVKDITTRRQAEEEKKASDRELQENLQELRRANIELGRLNAAKNSFVGMASHELKTPITSILGGVDFLFNYSGLELTEEQRRIFASVYEGVLQLKGLVADLLSFSRLETGGALQKRPLDLMTLAREVRETFALPLSTRQIHVSIADEGVPVPADEGYCRLVLRNLLENAIKFTPDGGAITVSGRLVPCGEVRGWKRELTPFYPDLLQQLPDSATFYRVDVSDTGIGIPPDERQRVFDKFYGIGDLEHHSSGKTEFMAKGTGLGLAIVRGIMDNHDGLVWNVPGPHGSGTVFSLLFPMEN